jgi:hypothetical protein
MSNVIVADERGTVHLSGEVTGATPHARYRVELQDGSVVLRPLVRYPADWDKTSARQKLKAFIELARQFPPSDVHLSDEQLRRENIYD